MAPPAVFTAGQLAKLVGGEVRGPADVILAGVASLEHAGPNDLTFVISPHYASLLPSSAAGAVLVPQTLAEALAGPATRIVVGDPRRAITSLVPLFHPAPEPAWQIAPSARIGRGTRWQGRVAIGDGAIVGLGVRLGTDCVIGRFATLGDGVVLGDECRVDAQASVESGVSLGHRVHISAGARVGGPGFGYVSSPAGHEPVPQVGRCRIDDDVDIGANCVVDRGTLGETVVGQGTKIDSLVKIAHNVKIGARCLIMAQTGVAGSAVVEDDAVLAGQVGMADHSRVGRGARVGAQSGVIGAVPAGATVSGYPARDHREVLRQAAVLRRLAPLVSSLEALVEAHGPSA